MGLITFIHIEFFFLLKGVWGGNSTGDIAIDDVTIGTSRCYGITTTTQIPTTVTSPARYPPTAIDCDFESAFCSWTQDTLDQFQWSMKSGRTSTSGTGPNSDHTYGTLQGNTDIDC